MKILIANPGSTSYKFKLLDTDSGENLFQAIAERIGDAKGIFSHDWGNKNGTGEEMHIPDYYSAGCNSVVFHFDIINSAVQK